MAVSYPKGLSFDERVLTVHRLAHWARVHFEMWRVYTHPDSYAELKDPILEFMAFTVLDEHAHRTLAILHLNTLFEVDPRTINLRSLLKSLAKARPGDPLPGDFLADLSSAHETIRKVARIRSGAIAHRTVAKTHDQIYADAELTVDQLNELISLAERCAEALRTVSTVPPRPPIADPAGDLRRLLERLRDS